MDRSEAERALAPIVTKALTRYDDDRTWYSPIVEEAQALAGDTLTPEQLKVLRETLAKTQAPETTHGDTGDRLSRWVATYVTNAAGHNGAAADDLKTWVTMHDDRVRASHAALDGKTIPSGEKFDVGGDLLSHPGEPVGDPSEWINCRCVLLYTKGDGMTASTAPVADAPVEAPVEPELKQFHGIAAPTDKPTGDRRLLMSEGFATRELPLPIFYQRAQSAMGHDGAVIVGQVTKLFLNADTKNVEYEGHWNGVPESFEAQQGVDEGWLRGVSVDLDDVLLDYSSDDEIEKLFEDPNAKPSDIMEALDTQIQRFKQWRIAGMTIVGIPAFQEAFIAQGPLGTGAAAPMPAGLAASVAPSPVIALVASGRGQALPPIAWFRDPQLTAATPITIDGDHVYGHIAKWGTCHVGFPGQCVTPPKSYTNYAWFRTGAVETDEGTVPVGTITMNAGHAGLKDSPAAAAAHYDNTATAIADVAAGEDAHGIWFSGRIRPGASQEDRDALLASKLSGDWRRVSGNLELVAALAVNTPGFPIPRLALAASAAGQLSLVAAGLVGDPDDGMQPAAAAQTEDEPAEGNGKPSDEELAETIRAIDAAIDSVVAFLNGIGDDALGPEGQQARDLAVAADDVIDQLMRDLGIPDPEDEAGQPGEPLTPGQAAALRKAEFARFTKIHGLKARVAPQVEQRRASRLTAVRARLGK